MLFGDKDSRKHCWATREARLKKYLPIWEFELSWNLWLEAFWNFSFSLSRYWEVVGYILWLSLNRIGRLQIGPFGHCRLFWVSCYQRFSRTTYFNFVSVSIVFLCLKFCFSSRLLARTYSDWVQIIQRDTWILRYLKFMFKLLVCSTIAAIVASAFGVNAHHLALTCLSSWIRKRF